MKQGELRMDENFKMDPGIKQAHPIHTPNLTKLTKNPMIVEAEFCHHHWGRTGYF